MTLVLVNMVLNLMKTMNPVPFLTLEQTKWVKQRFLILGFCVVWVFASICLKTEPRPDLVLGQPKVLNVLLYFLLVNFSEKSMFFPYVIMIIRL